MADFDDLARAFMCVAQCWLNGGRETPTVSELRAHVKALCVRAGGRSSDPDSEPRVGLDRVHNSDHYPQ